MLLSTLVLAWAGAASAQQFRPLDTSGLAQGTFFEQFTYNHLNDSAWVTSKSKKSGLLPYAGQWAIEDVRKYPGYEGDRGLVMKTEANYYAISRQLREPFQVQNQTLVFQFEVKFQDGISCGGSYFKLLSAYDPEQFNDALQYEVMFGPDICGSENKVSFIYSKHLDTKREQCQLQGKPMAHKDELLTLYTLVIRPNFDVEIRINGDVAKAGNLLEDTNLMMPPVSPPRMVPDRNARKPEDWDERKLIFDPSAQKPADYDAKYDTMFIPDPNAKKPEGWNDDPNEPAKIRDPNAQRPDAWNDAEDGVWVAPEIPNPLCKHGCGVWHAPQVPNPQYKGKWIPPTIENPNYRGPWKAPLVPNPDIADNALYALLPITGVGIEAWSMLAGVLFDNILLTHSVEEAEFVGNATFVPKLELERLDYKENRPRAKHEPKAPPPLFDLYLQDDSGSIWLQIGNLWESEKTAFVAMWRQFQQLPLEAILASPIRMAVACSFVAIGFMFVFGGVNVLLYLALSRINPPDLQPKKPSVAKTGDKDAKRDASKEPVAEVAEVEPIAAEGTKAAKTTGASSATKAKRR